jgi:DNA-directed RNA polymerase subunit RPC12/RpoP
MTVKASATRDSENTEVIKCPSCGKAMWISRKVNGQSVQCPHCAHVI